MSSYRGKIAMYGLSVVVMIAIVLAVGSAQTPAKRPTPQASEVDVTVTEGTTFAVAASPDGQTLVTDLLGSLWTIPAQGGSAKRITEIVLEAKQPSFSPDGRQIVFQGFYDADGWDLWTIAPDGSGAKRITSGPFDDMEPQWSHDGTRIAFSSDRKRNFDIWILDVRSGEIKQLTTNSAQDYFPAWSPDDQEIVFVSTRPAPGATSPSSAAGPATPPPTSIWTINVETGTERLIAAPKGRLSAPVWTPDGKQVLYNVIADGTSNLEFPGKPIVTGEDVFPFRPQFVSANEFLYAADGKIRKRSLDSGKPTDIAFSAIVPLHRVPITKNQHDFSSKPRKALGIVRPVISPDGKRVAFNALGDIWVMDIGSKPKRITNDRFLDADPAWSPDGSKLVFSSDRAETGNLDLWIHDLKTGAEKRLTQEPLADYGANWSPDGKRIAFLSMLPHQQGAAVDVVDVDTGKLTEYYRSAQRIPSNPTWSPDAKTLLVAAFDQYSQRFREGVWQWMLIPVDGSGPPRFLENVTPNRSMVNGVDEGPLWSPDGTKVVAVMDDVLQVIDVSPNGEPTGQFGKITSEASHSPSWTGDSRHILYLATDQLKMISLDDRKVHNVPLDLQWQPKIPSGRLVVHAGRLWNGRDQQEQHDVDIIVDGNRIQSIQPHQEKLHTGQVVDASGKTVIPGLIEMHGHFYREYGEALGRLDLAYGVTTDRDTAGMQYRSLEIREAIDSGVRMGPRFYISAPAIDGARGAFAEMYSVYDEKTLQMEMERSYKLGYDFFKLYVKLPEAFQKRVVEFGNTHGMPSTSHFLYPAVTFGVDGTEHIGGRVSALGHVYQDQLALLSQSGMVVCPSLVVHGGYNWLAVDDESLLSDPRLKTLSPDWAIEPTRKSVEALRKQGADAHAQAWQHLAEMDKAIIAILHSGQSAIVAGTDAPNMPSGVGLHGEIELYVRGGMTPVEALQTATINAAKALGADADLGSIETGKLADMVIVDGDPLADIKNARKVNTVIKNGEVYDMKTIMTGNMLPQRPTSKPLIKKGGGSRAGEKASHVQLRGQ
jgi:Tol biopolymer transport system component